MSCCKLAFAYKVNSWNLSETLDDTACKAVSIENKGLTAFCLHTFVVLSREVLLQKNESSSLKPLV